jgi:hypothetical protein
LANIKQQYYCNILQYIIIMITSTCNFKILKSIKKS